MKAEVKLFSRLREHLPPEARGETTIELPEGATIADLLAQLSIDEHVKLLSINGVRETSWDRELRDGDRVHVFPIVVGG
jgi:sulfur carrier protein ThiS